MTKEPKSPKRPLTAQEKIAHQKALREDLKGTLLSGRIAASTETATRVRVPKAAINQVSPQARDGTIPPPKKPPVPQPGPAGPKGKAPAKPSAPQKQQVPSAAAPDGPETPKSVAWDPRRLQQFIDGTITLGELENISKAEQYEMAKIGHQHLQQGRLDSAKQIFEGLVTLDPHDAYFNMALGSVTQRQGNLEEADRHYTRALEINPVSCHALANRGEVRMLSGKMIEGTKDLLLALEHDPDLVEESTRRANATISVVLQQLEEAGVDVGGPDKSAKT